MFPQSVAGLGKRGNNSAGNQDGGNGTSSNLARYGSGGGGGSCGGPGIGREYWRKRWCWVVPGLVVVAVVLGNNNERAATAGQVETALSR